MNHKLATIIVVLTLVIAAVLSSVIQRKKYESLDLTKDVIEVTKNVKLIDGNTDHNQALDVVDYAKKHGIKIPSTLVNFDTHSDIYLNADVLSYKESTVASWINNLLSENPEIKTVYWVMPMEEAQNIDLRTSFGKSGSLPDMDESFILFGNVFNKKVNQAHFVFMPLYKKAYKQEIYLDPKSGRMNELSGKDEDIKTLFNVDKSKLRKVDIITCTEKTLPDLKGEDVFLSIDADYVSNSGFDTHNDFRFTKDEQGVNATFYSIFKTLNEKNVRPTIVSLSLSPRYLPERHHEFVETIFKYITLTSNKFDIISTYKHKYVEQEDTDE